MNKRITGKERAEVTQRANGYCEYCLSPARFATQAFSVEHIHPRGKGGDNALDNLALACQGCNGAKHVKTTGYDAFMGKLFHFIIRAGSNGTSILRGARIFCASSA